MALGYLQTLRNSMMDLITPLIDAGASNGHLRVYDGARPASPETAVSGQTLLAEFDLTDPAFGAAVNGVITGGAIPLVTALATGGASWFRIVDSDDNAVLDGDVSSVGLGGDLQFSTTNFEVGGEITITALILRQDLP